MLRQFSFAQFRLGCVVVVLLVMVGAIMGQERGRPARRQPEKAKVTTTQVSSTAAAKPSPSPSPSPPTMVPVALVNPAQPEYMSGEANVTVKGNQNPTIRLGLAQNGVNVIEFPAADSFFMVHPGNSELVSFDEEVCWGASDAPLIELLVTLFLVSIPEKSPLLNSSDFAKEVIACSFLVFPLISTLPPLTFISRIVQLFSAGQRLLRSVRSW